MEFARRFLICLLALLVAAWPMSGVLTADRDIALAGSCCGCCLEDAADDCCGGDADESEDDDDCPCDVTPVPDGDAPDQVDVPRVDVPAVGAPSTHVAGLRPAARAAPAPEPRGLGPPRHLLLEVFLI